MIMKKFKQCLALSLAIIITIGVSGCMNILQSNESRMLKHLSQKYNGQKFITLYMDGGGYFGQGTTKLHCYPKGGDPKADRVWVETWTTKEGERIIQDSYFGIIIREDLEAEVLAACSGLPLPMKAYLVSGNMCYDDIFDGSKTYADFKQWINDGNSKRLNVTVSVSADGFDKSEKEQYANQIHDKLEKDGFCGFASVLFYPGEAFDQLTRTNHNELAYQYHDEYAIFSESIN